MPAVRVIAPVSISPAITVGVISIPITITISTITITATTAFVVASWAAAWITLVWSVATVIARRSPSIVGPVGSVVLVVSASSGSRGFVFFVTTPAGSSDYIIVSGASSVSPVSPVSPVSIAVRVSVTGGCSFRVSASQWFRIVVVLGPST
jgi:hypothetical protein